MPGALGVIPARFASTRFPGKALAPVGNGTLVEAVWRAARAARRLDRLVIATDDERIATAATRFGAEVMMTEPSHPSGTDRVAEVARRLGERFGLVVNIQGDEPLVTPTSLDALVTALETDREAPMATLSEPLDDPEDLFSPHIVKIVVDSGGRALYFSRSPIPFHRGDGTALSTDFRSALKARPRGLHGYLKHQGIFAFRRNALFEFLELGPSPLECDEGLEQLRALEAGYSIRVVPSDYRSQAVDTPADLQRLAHRMGSGQS